nr:MAG TPA: hypothetical protein [Caudoviricetes sp.]
MTKLQYFIFKYSSIKNKTLRMSKRNLRQHF